MSKCMKDGCARDATHAPKIFVPALGYAQSEERACQMVCSMELCRDHAVGFEIGPWLETQNDDGGTPKQAIETVLRSRSRVPPDWARCWVKPIRLDSVEFAQFERAMKPGPLQ